MKEEEAEISGQPGYRRKYRKSRPPAWLSAPGDNLLSNGAKQTSRRSELPDVIDRGKVKLPTHLSEEPPYHGDPRIFCKSINQQSKWRCHPSSVSTPFHSLPLTEPGQWAIFKPLATQSLLEVWGLPDMGWCSLRGELGPPACLSSPRTVGQRGLKERDWGGSLLPMHGIREHLMLVSTAGITNCGPSSPTRAEAEAWAGTSPMHSYPERAQGQEVENKLQMPILASFEEKKRLSGSQCLFSRHPICSKYNSKHFIKHWGFFCFFFFFSLERPQWSQFTNK